MAKRDLIVIIAGESKALKSALRSAARDLDSFASQVKSIGASLALTVTPAILGLGGAALKIAGDFEQSQIAFTTMLGSAERARDFLGELADFAKRTPFDLAGLQDAAKRMIAMGIAADKVIPTLTSVGDAVAAVGGGKATIDGVVTALGQMTAKAKVSAEEMMQLAERGIPAWEILANKIGVDVPAAMKLAEQGALDGITAVQALAEGLSESFGGTMEKQAQTLLGQIERIKDEAVLLLKDIGVAIAPTIKPVLDFIGEALGKMRELAKQFAEADPVIQRMVVAFAAFLAALGPILLALGGVATAITTIAGLSVTVIAALTGFGAAIAAAGALFVAFFEDIRNAAGAFMARWEMIWTGILFVLEVAKAAFVEFGGAAFFNEFLRQVEIVKAVVGAVFSFIGKIVKLNIDTIVRAVTSLADLMAKLPGTVGDAARRFKKAVADFETKQLAATAAAAQETADAAKNVGEEADKAAPKIGNWADSVIRGGDATKELVKLLPEIELMFAVLSDNKNFELAKAIEAAKNETKALADVTVDVGPKIAAIEQSWRDARESIEGAHLAALKLPNPLQDAVNAAETLGITLRVSVVQELENAKAAVEAVERAEREGLATTQDVIAARIALYTKWKEAAMQGAAEWSEDLQTKLDAAKEQQVVFTTESGKAWQALGNQISTILTDLGKSIADAILGAESLSDAFVNAAKAIAEAILRTIIEGALKLMLDSIKENEDAVGALISAFKKFIGLFTGSKGGLSKGGGKGGSGGGGGGIGEFGGVLDALDNLLSIVTNLINMFTIRRIEKDVARIEVTTRGMLNELLNARADKWTQHGDVLSKFDLVIPALWDVKEELKTQTGLLAGALGGINVSTNAGPTEVEPGPIFTEKLNAIRDNLGHVLTGLAMLAEQQTRVILPELVTQNALLVAILLTLQNIAALGGSGEESGNVPFAIPKGATSGNLIIEQVSVANMDPTAIGNSILEAARTRGARRGSEALQLKF